MGNLKQSETFCVRPFLHLSSRTDGRVLPCCVGKNFKTLQFNQNTFSEVWHSPEIHSVRQKMLSNQPVDLCQNCYAEEKSGISSHRMRSNESWKHILTQKEAEENTDKSGAYTGPLLSLDLRTGNSCNLACTMCGPNESSMWVRQIKTMRKSPVPFDFKNPLSSVKSYFSQRLLNYQLFLMRWHKREQRWSNTLSSLPVKEDLMKWYEREELWEDLKRHLPSIQEITIGGGEPFLIPWPEKLIQYCIEKDYAKNIALYYHTNGTLIKKSFFEKWRHFKRVRLFISLDAVGEKNHYIRYPSDWDKLTENLELVDKESPDNVESLILCTVQIKNMYYLPEFCEWIKQKNFKKIQIGYEDLIYTSVVHEPQYLSIQVYPKAVKQKITENFQQLLKFYGAQASRFQNLVTFMNSKDKSAYLGQFKFYTDCLDRIRGTNFKNTFPDLAKDLHM